MNTYKRHRFPPNVLSYAVWLCYLFNLSHRDIEELLAEFGITVCREAIRLRFIKFGALFTRRLKRKHRGYGGTFFINEVFVRMNGKQHYLWKEAVPLGVEEKVLILNPNPATRWPIIIPVREPLRGLSPAQTVVYDLDHFSTGKVGPTCS